MWHVVQVRSWEETQNNKLWKFIIWKFKFWSNLVKVEVMSGIGEGIISE
jgi:hypothetical protein